MGVFQGLVADRAQEFISFKFVEPENSIESAITIVCYAFYGFRTYTLPARARQSIHFRLLTFQIL